MKNHITTALFVAIVFFACKGEQHEKEIGDLNAVRAKLTQTDSLMNFVDFDNAEKLETEVKNNSLFVQFNINKIGDTIDFKTALFLSNYKTLEEALGSVAENGDRLEMAVDSTKTTLNNLEHDIVNNSLAKGLKAGDCIKEEKEHVDEMYEFVNTMRTTYVHAKAAYDSLTPQINDYMKVLSQKLADKNALQKK